MWGWHTPALHQLARHAPAGLMVEQGMFFVAGLLVWLCPAPSPRGALPATAWTATAAFPKLAGQRPAYLVASLQAFARGGRHSGTMESVAAGLDGDDLEELARYYAALPEASPPSWQRADSAAALELGEAIVQHGIPAQRVPACAACHGPGTSLRHPMYPRLAGQYPEYLALQLRLFKADVRGGTAFAHIVRMAAGRLTSEQMRAVALYYASVPPALDRPGF